MPHGFTLIELLVVVLIIGILAAVALPQYKLAVDKTRLVKLVAMVQSVVKAEKTYYLANGEYSVRWSELDLSFTGNLSNPYLQNDTVRLTLMKKNSNDGQANAVWARDSLLPDISVGAFYADNGGSQNFRGIVCGAPTANEDALKLCKNVSRGKYAYGGGTSEKHITYYRIL